MIGYYVYIEVLFFWSKGDKVCFINGFFSDVFCFYFLYSMVGSLIGELNIYYVFYGMELVVWFKVGL